MKSKREESIIETTSQRFNSADLTNSLTIKEFVFPQTVITRLKKALVLFYSSILRDKFYNKIDSLSEYYRNSQKPRELKYYNVSRELIKFNASRLDLRVKISLYM